MSKTTVANRPNQRAVAARAIELREAREEAGLTVDQLAGRVVDMWDARQGCGRRAKWQEAVDRVSREVSYLERASHQAYERADAWVLASTVYAQGGPDTRTGRGPRVSLASWREALTAAHHDDPSEAARQTLIATALSRASNVRAANRAERERARKQGRDIATLVWNAAEDPTFLDRALVDELEAVPPKHLAYLVRAALVDLADELRVTFPDRPARELRPAA